MTRTVSGGTMTAARMGDGGGRLRGSLRGSLRLLMNKIVCYTSVLSIFKYSQSVILNFDGFVQIINLSI